MFFETTYVPSPPLSINTLDEDNVSSHSDVEPTSDKPVDHLIFVIHGIGQQTEEYGRFYEHIENLQETTRQVLQTKVPDHNVRIELIPIEWHKHIHDQVDPIINKITLKSIPSIRLIENDYLADVLYYFSKDRGQNIVNNVSQLFNTSYHNFMEKHPHFDGKIVIIGYSLGGMITWDILSHQRTSLSEEEQTMYNKLDVQFPSLDFKPHYFFGFGSPIGAVLTFRGQDPTLYHPDFDIQFENIFHPFDPLGYRFEPLFNDYYTDKPAVLVERSVPIGPSFSFPTLPPSFFSFFSWKTEKEVMEEVVEQEGEQGIQNRFMSSFNALLHYFTKSETKEDIAVEEGDFKWDPLKEQTREQLLALRDDLDRTLNQTIKRPPGSVRSKTCHNMSHSWTPETPLKRTSSDSHSHHLVEVLGIDGVRVDSFERAQTNFKRETAFETTVPEGSNASNQDKVTDQEDQSAKTELTKLPGGHRMDYVLQPESMMSMIANEYLVGLRAHFSYWTNKDLIWHLLRRIENIEEHNTI